MLESTRAEQIDERTDALERANEELRKEIARRERVEEDLRRQKEILETILDHVPLFLKFVDKDGRLQMVNREWERVIGRSLDEMVNQGVDVYEEGYPDPVERQRVLDFVANSNEEWADFKTTVRDGLVIDTSWAVVRLSDGATICIGQDISQRKQAERDLRQQKEILQTIFDHIPVMVAFADQEKRLQLVNREWEQTLGWSLHEVQGQHVDCILAENYPDPEYRKQIRPFLANSDAEWADFKTTVRDGRVLDTSWAILHLSDGSSIGIGQDISERKRAEGDLTQQKEILQSIFDHIPLMISFQDPKRQLKLVNREWERTLGWSLEEIRTQNIDIVTETNPDPDDRERAFDFLVESNARWADFKTTVRSGQVIDTSWALFHLSDGSCIGIGQNISERKQAEWDLRHQKEILQTIFDHIPLMVGFVDQQGRPEMLNQEWERTLGWSLEEIKSQNIDIVDENYPDPEYRRQVRDFLRNSNGEWADFKTTVRDGRVIDTSWAMLHLSDGTGVGIGQDISQRKQAERDLRQQKEILQSIFDHIPVMINFVDQDGRLLLANREWEETLGWTLDEIENQNLDILEKNYPDPSYREQVRNFVENSKAEWADFKTTVRDGRVIDTSWAMLHLSDGSGIGIGQDITKRKRDEQALKESEERFRQLAENIEDLFWIKTPDFKHVLYLSPAYERFSGHSARNRYEDEDYQPFLEMIHPEDREPMANIMRSALGQEFEVEFRILHDNGSVRWFRDRGFPIRDQSGKVYRIAGIATDITDRKLAEEALRESEERFRQLTENIREVFWLRSPDLKQLLYVSPMYEKVCGRSCESLYEKGPELVVHPDDRSRVCATLETIGGREFEMEYRILTKDGQVRWLRDRGFPIRNQEGQIYRMGGVAEDITDRKEDEQRLKASSEQLRALSASLQLAREREATRIAHQIHDDMGGILTGLRWEIEALQKMILQPPAEDRLKAMQDKLVSMIGLTDTTINVVRRIASELRPSILDDLGLMEAIEWQAGQFQARTGIACRCAFDLQNIALDNVQSTALFRMVQEALTNIMRHAQATEAKISLTVADGILNLAVIDNGRGITQEEMHSRTSLGLLGMRERAHLIGAEMEIAGGRESGTTLRVRVPLVPGQRLTGEPGGTG